MILVICLCYIEKLMRRDADYNDILPFVKTNLRVMMNFNRQ